MIIIAGAVFALNGSVSKLLLLHSGFDAAALTAFRAVGAFLGLLLISATVRPGWRRLRVSRAELPRLLVFGLIGFFLVPMLYFVAISRLPVGIGLLLEYTGPVFVALWVRFGEHRQVKPRLWLGLALCLAGLAFVAQIWAGGRGLDPVGTAAGLVCAVLLAAYYVIGSHSVARRDPLSLTCWSFGISALAGAFVRPWWHLPVSTLGRRTAGVPMWLLAAYLVIFGTIAGYLLITASMRHLPPTSVGIVGMIEPVLASAIAWVLLGEVLAPAQIFGGFVVLAGVVLAETARTSPGPVTPEIPPA
jgi:drug/metabolite transporter (DMT)-like permease